MLLSVLKMNLQLVLLTLYQFIYFHHNFFISCVVFLPLLCFNYIQYKLNLLTYLHIFRRRFVTRQLVVGENVRCKAKVGQLSIEVVI